MKKYLTWRTLFICIYILLIILIANNVIDYRNESNTFNNLKSLNLMLAAFATGSAMGITSNRFVRITLTLIAYAIAGIAYI